MLSLLPLLACNKGQDTADTAPEAWAPEIACPGGEGCADGTGPLRAGASAVAITPTCFETWTDVDGDAGWDSDIDTFEDCGCDRLCEGDEGYPGPDEGEADGDFDALWLSGFSNGRAAIGVHDDLWARAIVLEQGDSRVAVVELDLIGWFYDHVLETREAAAEAGLDLDLVVVASTHQHEGPDTLGIWGQNPTKTGFDPEYADFVKAQILAALTEAVDGLTDVSSYTLGSIDIAAQDSEKGNYNLVDDSRDPVIIDETLGAAHFADANGATIATLVSWGNHPEALGGDNLLVTSDFADSLRNSLEDGFSYDGTITREGLGGTAIFLNAAVGGLMTPLHIEVTDGVGDRFRDASFEKSEALGKVLASHTLDALEAGEQIADADLSFAAQSFFLQVENWGFQAMFIAGLLDRQLYNWDDTEPVDDDNIPEVLTEVDRIELGPLQILTVPGELAPELAIGGYDGSRVNTELDEFIGSDNPNPPDVDQAPSGPYYKDMMAEHAWILGLANDEIGYILPAYDFQLDDVLPYFEEPDGDHYEETRSLGPDTAPRLDEEVARLLAWSP